jgi:8-oxo-dGTP pyrophosphatase MutT (NUDIX family)
VGETPEDAVKREAKEEAGITLGRVAYLGWFVLIHTETGVLRHAPTFIAEVRTLGGDVLAEESRGAQLVNAEDVASLYFAWDESRNGACAGSF